MKTEDHKFKDIQLDSDLQNSCSPQIHATEDFEGVVITAPQFVHFDKEMPADDGSYARIPICGYYMLGMEELAKDATLQFFARDINRDDKDFLYAGIVIDNDPSPQIPAPPGIPELTPEDLRGQFLGSYFNHNLAKYVTLPPTPTTYEVYVKIGNALSNSVTITLETK